MNKNKLQDLLKEREGLKLDFKREPHKLKHPKQELRSRQKGEFIKDILALTNGNVGSADKTAYLIYGVEESDGNNILYEFSFDDFIDKNELKNLSDLSKKLLNIVNGACRPPIPDLICELFEIEEKELFIISVPPTFLLHETKKDIKTSKASYPESMTFIRRGSEICLCTNNERENILREKKEIKARIEKESDIYKKLTDLAFIESEVIESDFISLLEDYSAALKPAASVPQSQQKILCLIQAALRKSEKVLSEDINQLASQLLGRLLLLKKPEIQKISKKFIESQKQNKKYWLKPLSGSLEAPVTSLIYSMRGNKRILKDIAVDMQSSKLISSYSDGSLTIWDLNSGKKTHTYQEHKTLINDFIITSNSEKLISASNDGSLKVRDLITGSSTVLDGHEEAINAISVTSDEQEIISASDDRTLKFWCLTSGECLHSREYDDAVTSIVITHDNNNQYVFFSVDNSINIIHSKSKDIIRSIPAHSERINSLLLSSDSENLISISDDETIKVWNLDEIFCDPGNHFIPKVKFGYLVKNLLLSPIEKSLLFTTIDDEKLVGIWEWESGKLDFIEGHSSPINALTITPDSKQIITTSSEPTPDDSVEEVIYIWDLENKKLLVTLKDHEQSINAVTISPNGQRFVSASQDKRIKIWDLLTREELVPEKKHLNTVIEIKICLDGQYAISSSDDETLRVWEIKSGSCLNTLSSIGQILDFIIKDQQIIFTSSSESGSDIYYVQNFLLKDTQTTLIGSHDSLISAIVNTPDGKYIVSASTDHSENLVVRDLSSKDFRKDLEAHDDAIQALKLSPEKGWLISYSEMRTVIWDLEKFERLYTFEGRTISSEHLNISNNINIFPKDHYQITANDRDVNIWDLYTGQLLYTFKVDSDYLTAAAITHNHKYLISTNKSNNLDIRSLERNKLEYSFLGHTKLITSIILSPCDRYIISISEDYTLKVWDFEKLLNQLTDDDSENDLNNYSEIATFTGDSEITTCAISPDMIIVAGEKSGRVHFLELCGF